MAVPKKSSFKLRSDGAGSNAREGTFGCGLFWRSIGMGCIVGCAKDSTRRVKRDRMSGGGALDEVRKLEAGVEHARTHPAHLLEAVLTEAFAPASA